MLLSHRHKFIYLKTMKTAGTSVEIFFQPECTPEPMSPQVSEVTEELVSEAGIVGARKTDTTGSVWFNHMPAAKVREMVGPCIWQSYFKFCVVRNPFDRLVSWWWHQMNEDQRLAMYQSTETAVYSAFNSWVLRTTDMAMDRDKYIVDGKVCVDRFLKYESLAIDIQNLCRELGLSKSIAHLGRYKSGARASAMPFEKYYDPPAAAKVASWFQWELDYFGYQLEPSRLAINDVRSEPADPRFIASPPQ
jgi:hypothetical protein